MRRSVNAAIGGALLLTGYVTYASQPDPAAAHVRVARAAAYEPGHDLTRVFGQSRLPGYGLCDPPKPSVKVPLVSPAAQLRPDKSPPPRAEWYAEPQKVFDNLYYVGGSQRFNHSAWAITSSEGIILIDSGTYFSAEDLIFGGLKKMNLDPAQVKYVVMTEGDQNYYGGAKLLQERHGTRVVMSQAAWDQMAGDDEDPPQYKPKKDMVATDGQRLTVGDVTVTLYLTPGHSPGDVSMVISPLKDGAQRHIGGVVSGRGWGVGYYKNELDAIRIWGESTKRFKGIVEKAGVDVFLARHDTWDNTFDKLNALDFRYPGTPHPFVSKTEVARYLTIVSECMSAQLIWREHQP